MEANANKGSRIPREQLAEAAEANQTVRQYLVELEQQNPTEEPLHPQDQVSTTDPDATYATKGGTPARLGYCDNYLVDNRSGGVEKRIGSVIYPRSGNTNPRALDEIVSVSQAYVQSREAYRGSVAPQ